MWRSSRPSFGKQISGKLIRDFRRTKPEPSSASTFGAGNTQHPCKVAFNFLRHLGDILHLGEDLIADQDVDLAFEGAHQAVAGPRIDSYFVSLAPPLFPITILFNLLLEDQGGTEGVVDDGGDHHVLDGYSKPYIDMLNQFMGKRTGRVLVIHLPYKRRRLIEADKDNEGFLFVAKKDRGTVRRRADDLFDFNFMEAHVLAPSFQ